MAPDGRRYVSQVAGACSHEAEQKLRQDLGRNLNLALLIMSMTVVLGRLVS